VSRASVILQSIHESSIDSREWTEFESELKTLAGREKMKLLERIQKEAKISFQNLYKFRRGDKSSHNIGFKQLCRLNDWLDNN
jgi:hypothetical protein